MKTLKSRFKASFLWFINLSVQKNLLSSKCQSDTLFSVGKTVGNSIELVILHANLLFSSMNKDIKHSNN